MLCELACVEFLGYHIWHPNTVKVKNIANEPASYIFRPKVACSNVTKSTILKKMSDFIFKKLQAMLNCCRKTSTKFHVDNLTPPFVLRYREPIQCIGTVIGGALNAPAKRGLTHPSIWRVKRKTAFWLGCHQSGDVDIMNLAPSVDQCW